MGNRPTRYAVLLAAAGLCAGALLTGCNGGEKPSPPPTGGGTVASGPTSDSPTGAATGPTSTGDPTTPGVSDPTSTSQPTPTATRTASGKGAPGVPEAARQHTKKGAEAFVRYYNKQLNVAWAMPKSGLLTPLSLPQCKSCAGYEDQARQAVKSGEHLDGPGSRIKDVEITPAVSPNVVQATVREAIQSRRILDSDGNVVGRLKAETAFSVSEVRWTESGWRMQSVKALK